jgi:hypothetical protein
MTQADDAPVTEAARLRADLDRFERRMSKRFAVFQAWLDSGMDAELLSGDLFGFKGIVERSAASFEGEVASLRRRVEAVRPARRIHRNPQGCHGRA